MKLKKDGLTYLSLLVTSLIVVSAVTVGGAVHGFAKSPTTAGSGNWTTDSADAARTSATTGSGPSGPYADTNWSIDPDGRPSGAVVEGDTAYLGVQTYDEYNRENGKVVAYNAETGDVRWNRSDLGGVRQSPTVANGTVYVAANGVTGTDNVANESGTPGLFALNAETGETKWRNNATKTWRGTPTVVGDTVYALGEYGNVVYAIDAETGATKNSYEFEPKGSDSSSASVDAVTQNYAVVGDTMYLSVKKETETESGSSYSGALVAVNTTDWTREWTAEADSVPAGLAVSNGAVYWTAQPNTVYKFNADDGTPRWRKHLGNGVNGSEPNTVTAPAVANGTVYVGTDDDESQNSGDREVGTVHALDARSGHEQWRFETAADVDTAPTVTPDTVFVGGEYPTQYAAENGVYGHPSGAIDSRYSHYAAYALNRSDGSERWSYAMDGRSRRSDVRATAPVNGRLYVWTDSEDAYPQDSEYSFYALNASDERPGEHHQLADDEPKTQTQRDETLTAQIATDSEDAATSQVDGGTTVTLSASTASDRENVTYRWDVDGDGTYDHSGETAELVTNWCGEHTVTLKAIGDDGRADTSTVTLTTS